MNWKAQARHADRKQSKANDVASSIAHKAQIVEEGRECSSHQGCNTIKNGAKIGIDVDLVKERMKVADDQIDATELLDGC